MLRPGFEPISVELHWIMTFWRTLYKLIYHAVAQSIKTKSNTFESYFEEKNWIWKYLILENFSKFDRRRQKFLPWPSILKHFFGFSGEKKFQNRTKDEQETFRDIDFFAFLQHIKKSKFEGLKLEASNTLLHLPNSQHRCIYWCEHQASGFLSRNVCQIYNPSAL